MKSDYYAVLGVPHNATTVQIRERFLQLARERHPDRFKGDDKSRAEAAFQAITEAYNVLSDPDRRRQHDRERARPVVMEREAEPTSAARVYVRRGIRAYKQKNYLEAAENFDRATRENPADPQAWHHLALACSHRKAWLSRALAAVAKACELAPMEASYLKLAGRLAARAGMHSRAEKYYRQALDWGGEDPQVEAALESLRRGKRAGRGLFGRGE